MADGDTLKTFATIFDTADTITKNIALYKKEKTRIESAKLLGDLSLVSDKAVFDATADISKIDENYNKLNEKIFDSLPAKEDLTPDDEQKLKQRIAYNLEHRRQTLYNREIAFLKEETLFTANKMHGQLLNGITAGITTREGANQTLFEIKDLLRELPELGREKLMFEYQSSAESGFIRHALAKGDKEAAKEMLYESVDILSHEHFAQLEQAVRNAMKKGVNAQKTLTSIIDSSINDYFENEQEFLNFANATDLNSLADYTQIWAEATNIKAMTPDELQALISNPNLTAAEKSIYKRRKAFVNERLSSDPVSLAQSSGHITRANIDFSNKDRSSMLAQLAKRKEEVENAEDLYKRDFKEFLTKTERKQIAGIFNDKEKIDEQFDILSLLSDVKIDSRNLHNYTNQIAPLVMFGLNSGFTTDEAKSLLRTNLQKELYPATKTQKEIANSLFQFRPELANAFSHYLALTGEDGKRFFNEKIVKHSDPFGETYRIMTKDGVDIVKILNKSTPNHATNLIYDMADTDQLLDSTGKAISKDDIINSFTGGWFFSAEGKGKLPQFGEVGNGKYYMFLKGIDGSQTLIYKKIDGKLRPVELDIFRGGK